MATHGITHGGAALLCVTILAVAASSRDARAAAGDLDASFGDGGVATVDVGRTDSGAGIVLVQEDGRIVVASGGFDLARLDHDGTLDATFARGGIYPEQPPAWPLDTRAAALQEDGKIVRAGVTLVNGSERIGLARYLPDGTLDPTFGTG